ncbi:hypothetical protein L7F22_011630 [Adiantum nelumboides]|nr:hypothetical protein [Adiantum nelumboides]
MVPQLWHEVQARITMSSKLLTPPPGNSLTIATIASDGKLKYVCEKDGGQWLLTKKRATLVDYTNHTKVVGFYKRNYQATLSSRHMGTWTLINSEGDQTESGHRTSLVSGKKLVTLGHKRDKLLGFLAQASLHQFEGAAGRVSYVVEMNTNLLASLPTSKCKDKKSTMSIGYEAEYRFWTQDLLPPKIPNSLLVPSRHHVVESFFAQGNVRFIYDQRMQAWRQRKLLARLYDVPGSAQVGGFSYNISTSILANSTQINNTRDLACISINNPNGFEVCGILGNMAYSSARQASLSWSLFEVTSNTGFKTQILGPFSYFQMVSTWGGLPPPAFNHSSATTNFKGGKSYFTSIVWLYTRKGA